MCGLILLGFMVGFGFALSVGPICLLMIRVNLTQGFWRSMMIGFGAMMADFTYLFLLSMGALFILNQPTVLKIVGILGAIILLYFGIKTWRTPVSMERDSLPLPKYHRNFLTGYLVCLSSPLSIIFWAGMAGTIAGITAQNSLAIYIFSISFFIGIITWVLILNGTLHFLRHQINTTILKLFNQIGGLAIIGFGIYGLVKVYG
jgi:L-lysine exporter family protein LysE/ArgO